jgi:hypothetical protein
LLSSEKYFNLRKILVEVVDLLDLAKVGGVVSLMNAEIIITAALRLIEEVDVKIHHANSFLIPKFSLSEMSDKLLRDRARDEGQDKYLNNKIISQGNEVFKFTKIPEPEIFEPGLEGEKRLKDFEGKAVEEKIKTEAKAEQKIEKSENSAEPLVYTFFGSEDKIIEDRKNKLLGVLKTGGGVSIGDIGKVFPGLNTKTLQRDLLDLMREKKVLMLGKKRWAKYYLK